jgi:DNA polymerase I-like protein with 3'-5' exonuclease and polymerase domains
LKNSRALLGERKDECHECPEAAPVLVSHDASIFECAIQQATDAKAWLEKAKIEGLGSIMNGTDEVHVPVEVEARIARSWGEED